VLWLYGKSNDGQDHLDGARRVQIDRVADRNCPNFNAKYKLIEKLVNSENPDVIYYHQVYNSSLIEFLTARIPSVRFVHDLKLICPEGVKILRKSGKPCSYPLGLSCQLHAYTHKCMPRNVFTGLPQLINSKRIIRLHQSRSHIVVASNYMKAQLLSNGFEERHVVRIPYFTYLPKGESTGSADSDTFILALGRVVGQKGFDCLLRVMQKVDEDIKLVLVGDGMQLNDLQNYARKLGISHRVKFTGWLAHCEITEYFRKCRLVVVPSIRPEPFGIVGIEAMAHGKPVVAFDVGGISDWCWNQKNGFLVKPCDETELAQKIILLLENAKLAQNMGTEGKMIARKYFMPETHLDALLELFDRIKADH
jgi:glycosyltransferase involved in cell wall biosynthesis